jgi:hypothetical protein
MLFHNAVAFYRLRRSVYTDSALKYAKGLYKQAFHYKGIDIFGTLAQRGKG